MTCRAVGAPATRRQVGNRVPVVSASTGVRRVLGNPSVMRSVGPWGSAEVATHMFKVAHAIFGECAQMAAALAERSLDAPLMARLGSDDGPDYRVGLWLYQHSERRP